MNHCWKKKRQSLSRPRRRNSHHILPLERHGPPLALNGRGRRKPALHNLTQDVFGHTRLLKGHTRLGYPSAHNDNLLRIPPPLRLLFRPLGHIGVLDVKVLLELDELGVREVNVGEIASEAGVGEASGAAEIPKP